MTFSDMNIPDYREDLEADPTVRATSRTALLTAMLEQADTKAVRTALLDSTAQVVVIKTPSAAWAKALTELVSQTYNGTVARAVTELKKDGNTALLEELQRRLTAGRSVVIVTQDPDSLLSAAVVGTIDVRLDLPATTPRMVAAAIGHVSGERAPSLKPGDIAGLDFGDLELALRDSSSAKDCVRRLRQAVASAAAPKGASGPRLEDLPLAGSVSTWANDLLDQMGQVETGQIKPSELEYPLLEGPPGTGKTLLASALARSAGWRFVPTSIGSWFAATDGHLGGVIRAATGFVDEVLAHERTIGFIDEADALPNRATLDAKDREWWVPVVTQVLLQIDRVRNSNRSVLLVGATNFYDRLDAALVRSGRLERRVSVLPPATQDEVARIFAHYVGSALDPATLDIAARLAAGATPATIEGWCRSARAKARADRRSLEPSDLLEAVAPADNRGLVEMSAVAIHEAGHVAVARHFGVAVHAVSIMALGNSGGHTLTAMVSSFPNRDELEAMATIKLGGRAADMVLGKGGHTGAEADLAAASRFIGDGIGSFGLYESLAQLPVDAGACELFSRTDRILKRLLGDAITIVSRDRDAIRRLADRLLVERVMTAEAIETAWQGADANMLGKALDRGPDATETVKFVSGDQGAENDGA